MNNSLNKENEQFLEKIKSTIGKDIIETGLQKNDQLCMKVIEKFTEIFAVEVGY